jgi:hypothetical protein
MTLTTPGSLLCQVALYRTLTDEKRQPTDYPGGWYRTRLWR